MFERKSNIIRDGSKLDYSYVPKNLVHREEQMARLETLFRPLAVDNRPCTAFLTGGVGTGKTVTARRFAEDAAAYMAEHGGALDVVYVNCRNVSEAGALLQIIRRYDPGFPERGFSTEEMARVLAQHLAGNSRGLLVILDEVEVLLKRGPVDIVYQLTRAQPGPSAPVSLIMISQEQIERLLDEASLSTFRRANTVRFNRYSRSELREIAASRAEEAIVPGRCTEEALDLIADESADSGDARMAIELLDKAANIAEDEGDPEITPEHVRAAKGGIYSAVSDSKLRTLDANRMVVLLAVARAMKRNASIPSSAAEKTYAVVCEEYGIPARKHTQFWTYLQDLDKLGAVRVTVVNDAAGRTAMVSLPDVPSKVMAEKMEALLEEGRDDDLRPLRQGGRDTGQA